MAPNTFDILLFIARPGAGKSEITSFLKHISSEDREARFHVGEVHEIDDFTMLWAWFEEDSILTEMGYPRLHTKEDQHFISDHFWNVLIKRLCLEYSKKLNDDPAFHDNCTTILEFSRGAQHGGYREAFKHLTKEVVDRLAIMYVKVSWEESRRKNRIRFNPNRPHSVLEHALADDKMETLYKGDDWESLSSKNGEFITIRERQVPYVVFENEDDVTTTGGKQLAERLESTLERLWDLYQA